MDYSTHTIHLIRPMADLNLDRIFPRPFSKRKDAFKLIVEGMTVDAWRTQVAAASLKKVDVSFITQCYAKNDPHRHEPKLVELRS